MILKFRSLAGILLLVASGAVLPSVAAAEPASSTNPIADETTSGVFNRAFFKNTPNFFRDQSIEHQFNNIFGQGTLIKNSYPENQDRRDANLVDIIYKDTLKQQVSSGPVLRTRDLPNPYSSSILELTSSHPNAGFETLPLR